MLTFSLSSRDLHVKKASCQHGLVDPYAQEAPLDLSVRAVKVDTMFPLPACAPQPPQYFQPLTFTESPLYYNMFQHQPVSYGAAIVPCSTAISPDSTATSPLDSTDFINKESLSDDREYQAYEEDALRAMMERNGGSLLGDNPKMRRAVQASKKTTDDYYRQQRERNNQAAKQSRDRRKLREIRLSLRVAYLEKKKAALLAALSSGVCGRCHQIRES